MDLNNVTKAVHNNSAATSATSARESIRVQVQELLSNHGLFLNAQEMDEVISRLRSTGQINAPIMSRSVSGNQTQTARPASSRSRPLEQRARRIDSMLPKTAPAAGRIGRGISAILPLSPTWNSRPENADPRQTGIEVPSSRIQKTQPAQDAPQNAPRSTTPRRMTHKI